MERERFGREFKLRAGTAFHDCVLTKPRLCARDTACARLSTFNLTKIRFTCVFTVSGVMVRSRAISLSMAVSRALNSSAAAEDGAGPGSDP